MEARQMSNLEKLQSVLNRSIHTPIERLAEFWDRSVPVSYMDIATAGQSDEARAYLAEIVKAQDEARKLLNRLTALRSDLEGVPDARSVVFDEYGQPQISGVRGRLADEVLDYTQEEMQGIRERFGR
jgi:hypothetical protein